MPFFVSHSLFWMLRVLGSGFCFCVSGQRIDIIVWVCVLPQARSITLQPSLFQLRSRNRIKACLISCAFQDDRLGWLVTRIFSHADAFPSMEYRLPYIFYCCSLLVYAFRTFSLLFCESRDLSFQETDTPFVFFRGLFFLKKTDVVQCLHNPTVSLTMCTTEISSYLFLFICLFVGEAGSQDWRTEEWHQSENAYTRSVNIYHHSLASAWGYSLRRK